MTTIKHIIYNRNLHRCLLTHWGRVTHLCVSKLTSIASDNGLSPGRRQAIIWNNAGILLIGPLWTNFSEILIEIHTFSLKKIRLKLSSVKRRPFSLGLNELKEAPGSRILRPLVYVASQDAVGGMPRMGIDYSVVSTAWIYSEEW